MINLKFNQNESLSKNNIKEKYYKELKKIQNEILNKTCLGNQFLEWIDWPNDAFYKNDYKKIQKIANFFQSEKIDTVVVIGIGGSYIGPKAGIEMLTKPFCNHKINTIFASGLHSNWTKCLINNLKNKNWAVIVISKSGTTFETAVNFRIFRESLYQKYGKKHAGRIIAITDENKGILKQIAKENNYETLIIPDGIGGRYSSLTPVGLLIMKICGINIDDVLKGWQEVIQDFKENNQEISSSQIYAAFRYEMLTQKNKVVEVFNTFENNLRFLAEHYKQIFAESEGKIKKCLIPTVANYSEDLHSIGQLYQDGNDCFFETTLTYKNTQNNYQIPHSSFKNDDNLEYLSKYNIKKLNESIEIAVKKAHSKIQNITIELDDCDEYHFGMIMAWMAISAATSALLLKVNPFDQPGVEAYKSEMKKLIK